MNTRKDYVVSSGNIFTDLERQHPSEQLAKAELARQINNLIKLKEFTQEEAAELLGIDQPKVSALSKGKLAGFSLERLFKFLNILGCDITIKVSQNTGNTKAQVNVNLLRVKKRIPVQSRDVASMYAQSRKRK